MEDTPDQGKNRAPLAAAARNAMLLVAAVLFVEWILMWVMLPTRTYSSTWAPKLAMLTDGTKFGKQGPRIMIFVLPVVILYVVACVYLHLLKGSDPDAQSRKRRVFSTGMAAWRRPVLVGGPLGIVTGIELAFLLMFLALLVWCLGVQLGRDRPARVPSARLDGTVITARVPRNVVPLG